MHTFHVSLEENLLNITWSRVTDYYWNAPLIKLRVSPFHGDSAPGLVLLSPLPAAIPVCLTDLWETPVFFQSLEGETQQLLRGKE